MKDWSLLKKDGQLGLNGGAQIVVARKYLRSELEYDDSPQPAQFALSSYSSLLENCEHHFYLLLTGSSCSPSRMRSHRKLLWKWPNLKERRHVEYEIEYLNTTTRFVAAIEMDESSLAESAEQVLTWTSFLLLTRLPFEKVMVKARNWINPESKSSYGFEVRKIMHDFSEMSDWGLLQYRFADNGWHEKITFYGDRNLLCSTLMKEDEVLHPEGIGPDGLPLEGHDFFHGIW